MYLASKPLSGERPVPELDAFSQLVLKESGGSDLVPAESPASYLVTIRHGPRTFLIPVVKKRWHDCWTERCGLVMDVG